MSIVAACALLFSAGEAAGQISVDLSESSPTMQIQEVKDALADFKKLQLDAALKNLETACRAHRELPPPNVIMFAWFVAARQEGPARVSLERAVVRTPNDPEAYVLLGGIALQTGEVSGAGMLFGKASTLMQSFAGGAIRKKALQLRIFAGQANLALNRRGLLPADADAGRNAELENARQSLEALLGIEPENANALIQLAKVRFQQGMEADSDRAVMTECVNHTKQLLQDAEEADPNVLNHAAQLALLYHGASEKHENYRDSAKQWMEYALGLADRKEGDDLNVRLVASGWYMEIGDFEKAKTQVVKALSIDPDSFAAKLRRGLVSLFLKDYVSAATYFKSAADSNPGSFAATNNLALALCEQPEAEPKRRALQYAARNLQSFARSNYASEAYSTYGWALYHNGQFQQAQQAMQQAFNSRSVSSDTRYFLAVLLARSEDQKARDAATQQLEIALESKGLFWKREAAQALLDQLKRAP